MSPAQLQSAPDGHLWLYCQGPCGRQLRLWSLLRFHHRFVRERIVKNSADAGALLTYVRGGIRLLVEVDVSAGLTLRSESWAADAFLKHLIREL